MDCQLAAINFVTAARFKGRKGKPSKKGFRRIMPKGRAKKGKGQGKGNWTFYGAKGKGATVAPTPQEDDDPTAFYDPNDPNPLNHLYWDSEWSVCVYDPKVTTDIAAAAMKGRKSKGGKKGGKQAKGQSGNQAKDACIKWSQNRCTYGNTCKYSHAGPGSLEPKGQKGTQSYQTGHGKGVAASQASLQQDLWNASQASQQAPPGYGMPNQANPSGTQWSSAIASQASQPQHTQDGSATLALMPYQPSVAAQRQSPLSSVHPEDRVHVERYMASLSSNRRGGQGATVASATLHSNYPSGTSGRDFSRDFPH